MCNKGLIHKVYEFSKLQGLWCMRNKVNGAGLKGCRGKGKSYRGYQGIGDIRCRCQSQGCRLYKCLCVCGFQEYGFRGLWGRVWVVGIKKMRVYGMGIVGIRVQVACVTRVRVQGLQGLANQVQGAGDTGITQVSVQGLQNLNFCTKKLFGIQKKLLEIFHSSVNP